MKQKLLSLLALAGAMFMSASAFGWDDPVKPTAPAPPAKYTGNWVAPESGGKYYIYNEGAALFLGGGQTWGTRGIVLCDSVVLVDQAPVQINNVSGNTTANYVLPFELVETETEGEWAINVLNNSKATSGAGHFVGEDGAQTWIDGDAARYSNYGAWSISEYQGGYMLQNINATQVKYVGDDGSFTRAFGVDGNNTSISWATTWTDLWIELPEDNTTNPQLVWKFVSADDGEAVRAYAKDFKEKFNSDEYQALLKAYQDAMEGYNAKVQLKAALEEAEEAGVNTDAAATVYNNPDATAEEVNAAIAMLKAEINREYFKTLLGGATNTDPIDATDYVLVNPRFDEAVGNGVLPPGWTITITGQNCGQQNRTDTNGSTGMSITNFIEAWHPQSLGDGVIAQTVYGLPAGKYVLECDASACHDPANGDGSDIVGVDLFVETGSNIATTRVGTARLGITHFSVTLVNPEDNDVMTFGLRAQQTNANWLSADNFTLTYYGTTKLTPAQANLEQKIADANNVDTSVPANSSVTDALLAAIEHAQGVLDALADDETCNAEVEALLAAQAEFEASVAAYEDFSDYAINDQGEFNILIVKVLDNDWIELAVNMQALITELSNKYSTYTLTTEEVNGVRAQISQLVYDYISEPGKVKEGDDLTMLLVNPDFSVGTTADPTGWTIKSGGLTELASATGNIEKYHEVGGTGFNISQTIKNMPAGVYDVTVQGFVRHDNASSTDETIFYAGDTRTSLMTLEDQWSLDPIYVSGGENPYIHDGNYDLTLTTPSGETAYKCNGMGGAYYWFQTPITDATDFKYVPKDGDNFYTNHIKITLREAGDLEIGLMTTSKTDWVIWDNFQISYIGNGIDIYYEMIEEAQEKMMAAVNAEDAFITKAADDLVNALNARVDKMTELETGDEALALISDIEAATEYIKAGAKEGQKLANAIDFLNAHITGTTSSDQTLTTLLIQADSQYNDPIQIENNEAVDGIIANLRKALGNYATCDAADEPTTKFDASVAIINADYLNPATSEYSAEFWTIENAYAADWGALEAFNNDSINIYQEIEGLKAGFYQVDVQGYYRAGNIDAYNGEQGDSLKQVQNAYIYAITSVGEMTTPLQNIIAGAQALEEGLGGSELETTDLEGNAVLVPNNMEAASYYFAAELYPNSLKVQVGEDGKLTLAVRKWNHIDQDWTIFTGWKLYYLGKTGVNFADELTAVENLNDANAKAAQIFTLDGRQAARMTRGINIVRMSDGSVRKVLVK